VSADIRLPETFGTREDPHAQEREARRLPLLLHSLSLFREVFEVVYRHHPIATVVEVGVESGQVSGMYVDMGASRVFCVDPLPSDEMRRRLAADPALELVEKPSPAVLEELPVADLYVVDGDHNYATVRGEVDWIIQNAPDAVIVLHDVLWPCSRRDLYYQPSYLEEQDVHPASPDGPTVWHEDLTPAGFVGAGAFTSAVRAGGERNGVLTAVEDAMEAAPDEWRLEIVPAVFGLGVLVRSSEKSARLMDDLRRYTGSRLLEALEANRIALYTRVLQLQFEAAAHAVDADTMAETINRQAQQVTQLREQVQQLTEQVAALQPAEPEEPEAVWATTTPKAHQESARPRPMLSGMAGSRRQLAARLKRGPGQQD
jgi:hypothetical protein